MKFRSLQAWAESTAGKAGGRAGVALVDGVGGGDDLGLALLAVDDVETGDGDGGGCAGEDEVFEDVAGADGGELVGVAHEEEVGAGGHGLEERGGEAGVEHRGLVHDEEIGGERVVFVGGEAAAGGVPLEEAVDGGGEAAGGLGEALGGAAGGRGEVDTDLFGAENFDEGAQDRSFTGTWSTGEY